jgi:hypothetical protein
MERPIARSAGSFGETEVADIFPDATNDVDVMIANSRE